MPRFAERAMSGGSRQRCHRGTCGTYVSPPCGKMRIPGECGRDFSSDSSAACQRAGCSANRRTGPRRGPIRAWSGGEKTRTVRSTTSSRAQRSMKALGEPAADIARSTSGTRLRIAQPPGAPVAAINRRADRGKERSISSGSVQKKPMSTPPGLQAARWCSKILKLCIGSPSQGWLPATTMSAGAAARA